MIRVIVNGANGKMGREIVSAVNAEPELTLVGATDINDDLAAAIKNGKADLVIDFTNPKVAFDNARTILTNGANAIIGTTGISPEQRAELGGIALQNKVAILLAPNFCVGAVLMMRFAAEAAKYMPNVEILEFHHDQKADAPSGTALATAEFINDKAGSTNAPAVTSKEMLGERSQGATLGNIRIHAVRLPGFVASQEVILGDKGQTLKIRHDTINRESFMPGIMLAAKRITGRTGLLYGLETLMFTDDK